MHNPRENKPPPRSRMILNLLHNRGFALIATISVLVLLALIAVGLLSLSSISLRSSTSQSAQQEAQANARMALIIALGELQKHTGPDTRITASSSVLGDDVAQKHITGVWNSRAFDPDAPTSLNKIAKNGEFRTWLCSGLETNTVDYANKVPDPLEAEVLLTDDEEIINNPDFEVTCSRIPIDQGTSSAKKGSFAYCVFDEGLKANVRIGHASPSDQLSDQTAALGSGQRPGIDRIPNTGNSDPASFSLDNPEGKKLLTKMVSFDTAEIIHEAEAGDFHKHFHNITSHSTGILCNVAQGGLKRDLNLIAESRTPPPSLANQSVYQDAFNLSTPSSPLWDQLVGYLNLYRAKDADDNFILSSSGGVPLLQASAPTNWSAGSKVISGPAVPNTERPSGPVLMPAIAKAQMIFSLAARDIYRYPINALEIPEPPEFLHSPWAHFFRHDWQNGPVGPPIDSEFDYLLHLVYTPVITLHNPYNVAIEFNELRVEFIDIPFSMQVFRNGEAQSNGLVPLNAMFGDRHITTDYPAHPSKRFGLNLTGKDSSGAPNGSPIRMAPGEVKIFSPYIDPERTWDEEINQPLWFVDWANNNAEDDRTWTNLDVDTSQINAVSGWRGDGIGFDLDSLAPGDYNVNRVEEVNVPGMDEAIEYRRNQVIPLRKDDQIHVEFAPIPDPSRATTRFTLEATLIGVNPDDDARTSVIDFEFEEINGLQNELLGEGETLRYPATEGEMISRAEIFDHSSVAIGSTSNTLPFALFSAYAKTTFGGNNSASETTNNDGSYASKPWSFHNHSALTASQNIISEHPAQHSHEINFQRLPGNLDEIIEIQPGTDRGRFITGHSTLTGTQIGAIHDIPVGPAQNLTMLNTAMPAAAYDLPRFTRPIGNSFAHPLLPTDVVTSPGPSGQTYADHSFLLNSVFYDGYYCSGIQSREGSFGDNQIATSLATAFLSGNSTLTDTRLTPYLSNGNNIDQATADITSLNGYSSVAAYQLVNGAFNVNSTSVDAWKALLSSMTGNGAKVLNAPLGTELETLVDLQPTTHPKGARFSRFLLPNGQPDPTDPNKYWQSSLDISDEELTALAGEIVRQVKLRGPFLSMSDFVNRQIGAAGEMTLTGALQAAIDQTDINDNANLAGFEIEESHVEDYELSTSEASTGSSAQGAPGYLTQADLLSVLGNAATVRSDTFVIRSYGDSRNAQDEIVARAWCEATVQRVPDFIDSADNATTSPSNLTSPSNITFGRKFVVTSFRWLNPLEI